MARYSVTTWHGEGRSAFYLVDGFAPESDQPAVVATFHSRAQADEVSGMMNYRLADQIAHKRLAEWYEARKANA